MGEGPQLFIKNKAHFTKRDANTKILSLGAQKENCVHIQPGIAGEKSLRPTKSRPGMQLKDKSHRTNGP